MNPITVYADMGHRFLLAKLHVEYLFRKTSRKVVISSLKCLPLTVDEMYSDAVRRVYSQAQEIVELALSVIFWICARRPLSVGELQHL